MNFEVNDETEIIVMQTDFIRFSNFKKLEIFSKAIITHKLIVYLCNICGMIFIDEKTELEKKFESFVGER